MAELPLVLNDVSRWYAATTLALGERTGLLRALLAGAATAGELAERAGVDARNAEVWAAAMTVAGYARTDEDRYAPDEDALGILRGGVPFDLPAVVGILAPLGGLLPSVEQAIRDGGGISSDVIQRSLGVLPERINGPMYDRFLVEDWIAGHPQIAASLRAGIDVAEIGAGGGRALRILARAYPASRFVGYDLDRDQVARATDESAAEGLSNLRFEALDAAALPADTFGVVCVFDAFHHFGRPDEVLDAVRGALGPEGSLLIAEAAVSGDPAEDAADPMAILVYGTDLLYCFQESKANGGAGLGGTWAARHLAAFLVKHGFAVIATHVSRAGYAVTRARPAS